MIISSDFDGGNIHCIDAGNNADVQLEIKKDNNSDFCQWFYFRASNARGENCVFKIINAGIATYPRGWREYRAVASYDRENWFRVDTEFDGQTLSILHRPEFNSVYYAYFAPYSMERHLDFIADVIHSPIVESKVIGSTIDGQDMDLLIIGDADKNKKIAWVTARQHPGETMAQWWIEGFVKRLVDRNDPLSREVLHELVFYIVPNMNPDGSKRGHLRTNAMGANLNREWSNATQTRSPEVYCVREQMRRTGVNFSLDVHGDESIPYNFIAGTHGINSWSKSREQLLDKYKSALMQANPDFQIIHGYPSNSPGTANLGMCTNYIAQTFGCLSMTLEMPFKDSQDYPDEIAGWSPERCRKLGIANVDAIYSVIGQL